MFLLLCCNDNDDKGNDTANHDVAKYNLYSTMCIKKGTVSGHVSEPATWYSKNMWDSGQHHLGIDSVMQFFRDLENILSLGEGTQDGGDIMAVICQQMQARTSLYRLSCDR